MIFTKSYEIQHDVNWTAVLNAYQEAKKIMAKSIKPNRGNFFTIIKLPGDQDVYCRGCMQYE